MVKGCVSVRLVAHLARKAQLGVDIEGATVEFDRLIGCPSLTDFVSGPLGDLKLSRYHSLSRMSIDLIWLQGLGDLKLGSI